MKAKKHTIYYVAAEPGTLLYASEANRLVGLERKCAVVNHRAKVQVEYLIELADGSRQWHTAENDPMGTCADCEGSGSYPTGSPCASCEGSGRVPIGSND